jgi:hypothetical protein
VHQHQEVQQAQAGSQEEAGIRLVEEGIGSLVGDCPVGGKACRLGVETAGRRAVRGREALAAFRDRLGLFGCELLRVKGERKGGWKMYVESFLAADLLVALAYLAYRMVVVELLHHFISISVSKPYF